jgi:hypothetical protein
MADRSRCPNCHQPVSPFAAGCAVCGADLDTKRWDAGPSLGNRIGSWFSALGNGPTRGGWTPWIVILVIFFGGSIVTAILTLFP